jgi:hypothetical protein
MKPWHYILIAALALGAGFGVYWFYFRKPSPGKKALGPPAKNTYTVQGGKGSGGDVDANGVKIGQDNQDGTTYTTVATAAYQYGQSLDYSTIGL